MMKRILTLILCVCTVFSSASVFAASDTELKDTAEKYSLLCTLGIFAQADINDSTPWTREQFVQACAGLVGIDAKSKPVEAMIQMGVIKGYPDSNLHMNENIKFIEALVMVIRVLGYEDIAQNRGSYPGGYLSTAISNGIYTKGDIEAEVVTPDVVELLYSTINAPAMDIKAVSSDRIEGVIKKDVTVLDIYLNIRKIEGKVTSAGKSAIGSSPEVGNGKVIIDGVTYNMGDIDMTGYIGLNVMAYADMDPDTPEIIWASVDKKNQNSVIVLNSNDIIAAKGFDDGDTYAQKRSPYVEYDENDRSKKLVIDIDCDVLYNGFRCLSPSDSALMPKVGQVSFVDSDNDGRIDFCNVISYEVFVVDCNSADAGIMTFLNSDLTLDVHGNFDSITKYGTQITIDAIQSGDTVHIGTDLREDGVSVADAEHITVSCITDSFSGKITEMSEDKVLIDGVSYEISKAFRKRSRLEINKKYSFYKDIYGRIVEAVEDKGDGVNYGYLFGAKKEKLTDDDVQVQILTKSDKFEVFKLAKRLRFVNADGDRKLSASELYDIIAPGDTVSKQVVRFTLSDSGEINELRLAIDKTADPAYRGVDYDNFTLDETGRLRIYTNSVGRSFQLDSNTVVIMIPDSGEKDDFTGGGSGLVGGGDIFYNNTRIYDVNEAGCIRLLTVPVADKKSEGPTSSVLESNLVLIDSVTEAYSNDEFVYKIYGLQGKKEVVYTSSDGELKDNGATNWAAVNTKRHVSELTRGDVVQIGTNRKGEADILSILCSFDGDIPEVPAYIMYTPNDGYSTLLNTAYGAVVDNVEGDFLRVSSDPTRLYALKYANIYVYDMKKDEIRLGVPGEITTDDWVFIRNRRAVCHEVVVYRR